MARYTPDPGLTDILFDGASVCILCGHYGVGKTNLALNAALSASAGGLSVTIADLDLVNPYFRSSDFTQLFDDEGISLIAPTFAGTTLDTPSIGGQLFAAIEDAAAAADRKRLIIDAGGDDVGATALGYYADALRGAPMRMFYVVNAFRNLTQEPVEAAAVLREIESAAHLEACGIVNNSHLCDETTPQDVEEGRMWAYSVADACQLPLVATCVPAQLFDYCYSRETGTEPILRVGRYVLTPWQ